MTDQNDGTPDPTEPDETAAKRAVEFDARMKRLYDEAIARHLAGEVLTSEDVRALEVKYGLRDNLDGQLDLAD